MPLKTNNYAWSDTLKFVEALIISIHLIQTVTEKRFRYIMIETESEFSRFNDVV